MVLWQTVWGFSLRNELILQNGLPWSYSMTNRLISRCKPNIPLRPGLEFRSDHSTSIRPVYQTWCSVINVVLTEPAHVTWQSRISCSKWILVIFLPWIKAIFLAPCRIYRIYIITSTILETWEMITYTPFVSSTFPITFLAKFIIRYGWILRCDMNGYWSTWAGCSCFLALLKRYINKA